MRAIRILILSALLPLVAVAGEMQRFESYGLGASDPAAVEQVARQVVGAEGTVVLDAKANRLLVVTTEERHAQLKPILERVATPPKNVKIDVSIRRNATATAKEASVSVSGDIEFENSVTKSRIRIQPKLENRSDRWTGDVNQMLLVASGREGILHVGQSVPYLSWLMQYGVANGVIAQQIQWQDVGSRLVVEPTVLDGGMIRIRITPELSGMVDGRPYHTRFASVATEVFAQDGETIRLGGFDQGGEFYSRFLVGGAAGGSTESIDISLTPRVMNGGAP